jgi:hypothetical protein
MNANDTFTAAECNALNEVRKLLGDNLADFLLSGLGETSVIHRRTFSAQNSPSHGGKVIYQLEMVNDTEQGLPIGRDPLVLAVLLDLLWERQPLHSTILFKDTDILEKLQWDNNTESKRLIKQALERYFLTAYCLIDPAVSEEERFRGHFASVGRLLLGFENTAILLSPKRTNQPRQMRVHFFPSLIHDVISERKYFLGIEFQRLRKIDTNALP